MQGLSRDRTRTMTVIAQDPSVTLNEKMLRSEVTIPEEDLKPGPWGYRIHVVDYDASTNTYYKPRFFDLDTDPYKDKSDDELLKDPQFHCQNVYALVMRALTRFEFALGRRVSWSFYGHQLKVVPHAFGDANAFYSPTDHALLFGYFPSLDKKRMVFTCLSHDIVVHETTHALVDGLRERYIDPSSPDQAAFHEGFSDIVALLSVFSLQDVTEKILDLADPNKEREFIALEFLKPEIFRKNALLGLADEMGKELDYLRGDALRRSATLEPSESYYSDPEYFQSHKRGEILVAAVMNAMLRILYKRIESLGTRKPGKVDRYRVTEDIAKIADILLTICIRAIDYCPPVDIQFGDFLSALLTADKELYPDDTQYCFRENLTSSFRAYGIKPAARGLNGNGAWEPPDDDLNYDSVHFHSIQISEDEVFHFIWENRTALDLFEDAYSRVLSVRPCMRTGPDGFVLHETVAEFMQTLILKANQLGDYGLRKPDAMPDDMDVKIHGGGSLIFNEWGRLKYNIHNRIKNFQRQQKRLDYLWEYGYFDPGSQYARTFADMNRMRAVGFKSTHREEW